MTIRLIINHVGRKLLVDYGELMVTLWFSRTWQRKITCLGNSEGKAAIFMLRLTESNYG